MIDALIEVGLVIGLCTTISLIVFMLMPPARRHHNRAATLEIRSKKMASVVEGGTLAFTVVAKNKKGVVVPDTGIKVSVDAGAASVNDDGSGGLFAAGDPGVATLVATDGTINSDPFVITVSTDVSPATLEVVAA